MWKKRSRTDGTNLRALGINPRALRTNERVMARNKWALRNWKRKQHQAAHSPGLSKFGQTSARPTVAGMTGVSVAVTTPTMTTRE